MRGNNSRSAIRTHAEIDTDLVPEFGNEMAPVPVAGPINQMVSGALSLKRRGGIGNDGLIVQNLSARLRMQLLARSIHPWDRDRPAHEKNEMFVQQCLEDVGVAIPNLFRSMPEIDEMEVVVLDPRGKYAIISGIVKRRDVLATHDFASAGMKLRAMGFVYGRSNSGFERMEQNPVLILDTRERPATRSNPQE